MTEIDWGARWLMLKLIDKSFTHMRENTYNTEWSSDNLRNSIYRSKAEGRMTWDSAMAQMIFMVCPELPAPQPTPPGDRPINAPMVYERAKEQLCEAAHRLNGSTYVRNKL